MYFYISFYPLVLYVEKCTAFFYFLRRIYLVSFMMLAGNAWYRGPPQAVRITDAWQCIRLITVSILGRYAFLRNNFLVTRDMNSHRLTTLLTSKTYIRYFVFLQNWKICFKFNAFCVSQTIEIHWNFRVNLT